MNGKNLVPSWLHFKETYLFQNKIEQTDFYLKIGVKCNIFTLNIYSIRYYLFHCYK